MPCGQTGNFYIGINFTAILKSDDANLKDTLKNYRAAIDVFLPGESTGKKVCARLRGSAVNIKINPLEKIIRVRSIDNYLQVAYISSDCRGGETGRRTGLKIQRTLRLCGFDSRPRHQ